MILRYTPRARQDLNEIKNYVKNELANPQAAARIVERILKGCSNLKSNPNLGLDLSSRIGQKTDLRYLVLSNYIAIYRVENTMVSIISSQITLLFIESKILWSVLFVSWMAGRIICVTYCRRYDFITICEHSKFATRKERRFSIVAENTDGSYDGLLTLHLTSNVKCSVFSLLERDIDL